jgi:hypothetical protein
MRRVILWIDGRFDQIADTMVLLPASLAHVAISINEDRRFTQE